MTGGVIHILRSWRARAALAVMALLASPVLAWAAESGGEEDFDPSLEFELTPYVNLDFGWLDLSINKAVVYLLLSTFIICVGSIWVVRGGLRMRPTKGQNFVEIAYEFSERQIASQSLPQRSFKTWFPYVTALFLFIGVNNIISFIPLPVSHEKGTFGDLPELGLYAATANINVTLALAAVTFIATHVVGVRAHGPVGYIKTWIPEAPRPIQPLIFAIEVLSQMLRLVSLSVRLFANLLAGHLLIIMMAGFIVLLGSFAGIVALPFAVFFYVFEWVLVAGLQAFIFALLSGIYIGYAAEAPH